MIYFFSLDALFEGNAPAPGAIEVLRAMISRQERFLILTDKANRSRRQLSQHLYDNGFPLLYDELFYTSTMAAVDAVRRNYPNRRAACYLGNEALGNTLREGGFIIDLRQADWLFIGSNRNAAFRDYSDALSIVLAGATMISVSDEPVELHNGMPVPGVGAMTSMLETASGRKALHAGWPAALIMKKAARYLGCEDQEILFVSKKLRQEVIPAKQEGFRTVFLIGNQEIDENLRDAEVGPDYVLDSLKAMLK